MNLDISREDGKASHWPIMVDLPDGGGRVLGELTAREERPGGFEWLQVVVKIWYRHVLAVEPFTESIEAGTIETWVPVDAVTFLDGYDYSEVRRMGPGEGRPPGAPR
ncbi:hypothetical protein ABT215_00575 [Streptomyces sp900105755]|uniref:hypothetical protein n=1 Tax=Streptomyces sp. 900105755 TaxID=3154389 RepID=UPI0033217AD7